MSKYQQSVELSDSLTHTVSVKHLSEKFTEEEFRRLRAGKGERSWREALLQDLAEDVEDTNE